MANNPKEVVKKALGDNVVNKDIMGFLTMIADNSLNDKNDKDVVIEAVRKLFDEGFEIHDPTMTKKIGSKVLQQAIWRVMSKVKFLDCTIHGSLKDENTERLVTEGVMTVTERGRLGACFRGKAGVFFNAFLYGDGYLFFGKGENDENPVIYRVLRNEDVYFDSFAYGVRGVRPANKMAVIYQYDKDEAYELYPELEENNVWGRIPGTYKSEDRDADREDQNVVEICWAWNKAKKKHVIFAGTQCFQIDSFDEEEYPAIKNKQAYIPVFQFMCMPSADGPRNRGIGEMIYDLAVITRKLLNLEVTHLEENVLPFTFVNTPSSKLDELIEKMEMANDARKKGKLPVVAMEFSQGGQQGANMQSLTSQNLFNEWNVVWDRLYREIARLGINLDDIERGAGITRGQVIAEEQASNAFVLQMMEYNAEDSKELIECTMDAITEYVSPKNKTILNLRTQIMLESGEMVKLKDAITMGMLSKTLKEGNWFVDPDVRTGAIPSDLTKMIQEERLLGMTPPGTPEYSQVYKQIAMRMGSDIKLNPPVQMPGVDQSGQPQGAPQGQRPAETQRILPAMAGTMTTPV